jgi:hypothetical protein
VDRFSKNTQISTFMKICPVGDELFHADGRTDTQTDIMKLIFAFRNFANAPKIGSICGVDKKDPPIFNLNIRRRW